MCFIVSENLSTFFLNPKEIIFFFKYPLLWSKESHNTVLKPSFVQVTLQTLNFMQEN